MARKKEKLPSERDLRELPRWARVAFAARCARRVQPLFTAFWPGASAEDCEAIERAIGLAEARARTGGAIIPFDACDADAAAAADAARRLRCDALAADAAVYAVDAVARAAAYAADAAAHAAFYDAVYAATGAAAAYEAARVATGATSLVGSRGDSSWRETVVQAFRADLAKLRAAAKKGRWTHETPVPAEFFGPLGPEGELAPRRPGATEASHSGTGEFYEQPPIDVYVDPRNASRETIKEVLAALSDLHVACGGLGLEFKSDGHFVRAVERVAR